MAAVMDAAERREHLLMVVDHLTETHDAWVKGEMTQLNEAFELATTDMLDVFQDGTIPGDLRDLNHRVDQFREQWQAWVELNSRRAVSPIPGNGFWHAFEAVRAAREAARPKARPTLESIKSLKEQKVSDRQICKIYGWLDPGGNPEIWKVQEELDDPGRHSTKIAGWLPPHERKRQESNDRQQRILDRIRADREAKLARAAAAAPEDFQELVESGVSARQIAKMKHLTVDEVFAECARLGIGRPRLEYDTPNAMKGQFDKEPGEEKSRILETVGQEPATLPAPAVPRTPDRSGVDIDAMLDSAAELFAGEDDGDENQGGAVTLEQEIAMLHQQGMGLEAIKAAVSREGAPVDGRKISAVIRGLKRQEATA